MSGAVPFASVWRSLGSFLKWWADEVRDCIPPLIRRALSPPRRELIVAITEDGLVTIGPQPDGTRTWPDPVTDGERSALHGYLAARTGGPLRPVSCILRLPKSRCLVRSLMLPQEAAPKLRSILDLELERVTPFRKDQVLDDFALTSQPDGAGKIAVEHVIAKKEVVEDALTLVERVGYKPAAVDVWTDMPAHSLPVDLHPNRDARARRRSHPSVFYGGMGIAIAALIASASTMTAWRQEQALAALAQELSSARSRAHEVRRTLDSSDQYADRIRRVHLRKVETMSVAQLLREITILLPDDAHLIEFQLSGAQVRIVGLADTAEPLIEALQQSEIIDSASFAAPVTAADTEKKERFNIALTVPAKGAGAK